MQPTGTTTASEIKLAKSQVRPLAQGKDLSGRTISNQTAGAGSRFLKGKNPVLTERGTAPREFTLRPRDSTHKKVEQKQQQSRTLDLSVGRAFSSRGQSSSGKKQAVSTRLSGDDKTPSLSGPSASRNSSANLRSGKAAASLQRTEISKLLLEENKMGAGCSGPSVSKAERIASMSSKEFDLFVQKITGCAASMDFSDPSTDNSSASVKSTPELNDLPLEPKSGSLSVERLNALAPSPWRQNPKDYKDPDMLFSVEMASLYPSPEQIAALEWQGDLAALQFSRCWIVDEQLEAFCLKFPNVQQAVLYYCVSLREGSCLIGLSQLRLLSLSHCINLSFDFFDKLREGSWPFLEVLELSRTQVSGKALERMPPFSLLKEIDLSQCEGVDDAGFLSLLRHPSLQIVKIWETSVSDKAVQTMLEQRPDIKILQEPELYGIEEIFSGGVDETPRGFPLLRMFLQRSCNVCNWNMLAELDLYKEPIARFYKEEFLRRGLPEQEFDGGEKWIAAERKLQEYDAPSLVNIAASLLGQLRTLGFFIGQEPAIWDIVWFLHENLEAAKKITTLNLSKADLEKIPPWILDLKLPFVISINFEGSGIKEFEFGSFSLCPQLATLNLAGNHMKNLPEEFCIFWPQINLIDLQNNALTELPKRLGISSYHGAKTITLQLQGNQITHINEELLAEMTAAVGVEFHLDLSHNPIETGKIPAKMPPNVSLTLKVPQLLMEPSPQFFEDAPYEKELSICLAEFVKNLKGALPATMEQCEPWAQGDAVGGFSVKFSTGKVLDKEQLRELAVDAIDLLLRHINSHGNLRPYLTAYPCTFQELFFELRVRVKDGIFDPRISAVLLEKGSLSYITLAKDDPFQKKTKVETESYEQALQKRASLRGCCKI